MPSLTKPQIRFHTNFLGKIKSLAIGVITSCRKAQDSLYAYTYSSNQQRDIHNPHNFIVVAGLFSTANGIGALARSSYKLLKQNGYNVVAVDLSDYFNQVDCTTDIECVTFPQKENGTLLLYANGEETLYCLRKLGVKLNGNWKIIGVWAWELSTIPKSWKKASSVLDQLWTYSTFTQKSLQANFEKLEVVHIKPHLQNLPILRDFDHKFDIAEDSFVFLVMCDSRSSIDRKNPFAAITAFKAAFSSNKKAFLIVKTRNFHENASFQDTMEAAVSDNDNIIWIDATYTQEEYWSLLSRIDCFVSLHRAEGFGLPMAEAMQLGKPVIATNWSANLDFMDSTNSLMVNFELIKVRDNYKIYKNTEDVWAEPDILQASNYMKQIASKPEFYRRLSIASKKRILEYFDSDKIIKSMDDCFSNNNSLQTHRI